MSAIGPIVFAMVVKPTTDDGWTIAIVVAVLVALTAGFLAPLRATGAHSQTTASD